ncbi:phage tail tip lysozyme [Kozakia baliensis]|uniref:phage tail tip lysozyme n=1 Tax=Kozakia baliensis TaxID=153496 RepID=UPI00345BF2A7
MSVIDSLVIELGLDASKMSKGQKQAMSDLRKFERAAEHTGENVQESGKKASDFFSSVRREALGMFAVFTAGRSLKAFISDTTKANAQLGYMSHNLGIPAQNLTRMQVAAQMAGGSLEEVGQTYSAMQKRMADPSQWADIQRQFQQLGLSQSEYYDNATHGMRSDVIDRLNASIHRMKLPNPVAQSLLESLGFGTGQINEALMDPADYRRIHGKASAIPTPSPQELKASQQLSQDIIALQKQSESEANILTSKLAPSLDNAVNKMLEWERENPNVAAGIGLVTIAVRDLNGALNGFGGILAGLIAMKGAKGFLGLLAKAGGAKTAAGEIADWARPKVAGMAAEAGAASTEAAAVAEGGLGTAAFSVLGRALPGIGAVLTAHNIFRDIHSDEARFSDAYDAKKHHGDRVAQALAYFQSQGYSRTAALGIIGNLDQESGLSGGRIGDGGKAFGVAQWHQDRVDDIKKRFGIDVRTASYADQLRAVALEMQSGGDAGARRAGSVLRNSNPLGLYGATGQFRALFERPANKLGNEDMMRFALVQKAAQSASAPNTTTVTVGDVHVHTNSNDPQQMASDFKSALRRQLPQQNAAGLM